MIRKKGSVGIATSIKWGQVSWNIASCFACKHFSVMCHIAIVCLCVGTGIATQLLPRPQSPHDQCGCTQVNLHQKWNVITTVNSWFIFQKKNWLTELHELNVTTTFCVTCVYTCLVSQTKQKAIGGYSYITNYSLSVSM